MPSISKITDTSVIFAGYNSNAQEVTEGSFADSLQKTAKAVSGGNVEHHTGPFHSSSSTDSNPTDQKNVSDGVEHHTGSVQHSTESNTNERNDVSSSVEHHSSIGSTAEQTNQVQPRTLSSIAAETAIDGVKYPSGTFMLFFETANTGTKSEQELADLLAGTEDMLSAPQRMQEALMQLISEAFEEINDPTMDEEEFTEMVLDFLMKYIDEEFGGEIDSSSIITDDEDEDHNIHDVLLQAVVQMLEEIRSENAEAPAETEEIEEVGNVPASDMPNENAGVSASELLGYETKETDEVIEAVTDTEQTERSSTQTESTESVAVNETDNEEPKTEEITAAAQSVNTEAAQSAMYQAAAQAAESIYAAVTRPQKTEAEPIQPVKAERTVSVIQPADELEELTRLVRGGDTVKSGQTETQLLFDQGEKQETEETPAVKLDAIGETVPFEAAIARSASQPTPTNSFAGVGSGAQQVVSQIASEIFNNLSEAGNGTTTFVMTLNPESLGKVTVKMVEEAGKLSVTVTAHSKHTAELLSDRFENLQAAMKDNGTQLEKYQVVYAPEHDEGSQQSFDGSSKNPYVRQDSNEEGEGGTEFAELLQQTG